MFNLIKAYYKALVPAITDADWNALEEHLIVEQVKKGDFLVRQGEVCRQVSFVNEGLLQLFYLVEGREISTGFVAENNYISEYASFLTRTPAAQNIKALEDCELIHLSFDTMQALYRSHPVFELFGRKMAEHIYLLLSAYNTSLRAYTPEQWYQFITKEQPHLIQRVPQYMLASFIGITPQHLSRLRNKRQ